MGDASADHPAPGSPERFEGPRKGVLLAIWIAGILLVRVAAPFGPEHLRMWAVLAGMVCCSYFCYGVARRAGWRFPAAYALLGLLNILGPMLLCVGMGIRRDWLAARARRAEKSAGRR